MTGYLYGFVALVWDSFVFFQSTMPTGMERVFLEMDLIEINKKILL